MARCHLRMFLIGLSGGNAHWGHLIVEYVTIHIFWDIYVPFYYDTIRHLVHRYNLIVAKCEKISFCNPWLFVTEFLWNIPKQYKGHQKPTLPMFSPNVLNIHQTLTVSSKQWKCMLWKGQSKPRTQKRDLNIDSTSEAVVQSWQLSLLQVVDESVMQ